MRTHTAAALLGLTERGIRKAAADGRLPGARRDGWSWDVPASAVAHVLAERTRPGRTRAPERTSA